jgi:hypothetical protein
MRELGAITRYHCWSRVGFPPHKHSDLDRLRRRHGEFESLYFSPQSDVVLVGVQDPMILHSEDDNMQHIVIIGRFDELMPTFCDPAKPLDINIKKLRHLALLKPFP